MQRGITEARTLRLRRIGNIQKPAEETFLADENARTFFLSVGYRRDGGYGMQKPPEPDGTPEHLSFSMGTAVEAFSCPEGRNEAPLFQEYQTPGFREGSDLYPAEVNPSRQCAGLPGQFMFA